MREKKKGEKRHPWYQKGQEGKIFSRRREEKEERESDESDSGTERESGATDGLQEITVACVCLLVCVMCNRLDLVNIEHGKQAKRKEVSVWHTSD